MDLPFPVPGPMAATADGIATYDLIAEEGLGILKLERLPSCMWDSTEDLASSPFIEKVRPIVMVFEVEKEGMGSVHADRQLSMCMTTAFHHRIALGIDEEGDDFPVYGLTLEGTLLRLYTGHGLPQKPSEERRTKAIVRWLLHYCP